MQKWSRKFVLNYQTFNQDTFQKYLRIKMLYFPKSNPKTCSDYFSEQGAIQKLMLFNNRRDFLNVQINVVQCMLRKDTASLCLVFCLISLQNAYILYIYIYICMYKFQMLDAKMENGIKSTFLHLLIETFLLLYKSFVSLIRISRNIKQKLTQQLIQTN